MQPVRCFSCNAVVKSVQYKKLIQSGYQPNEVFEILNVQRYCCRRMLLG